MGDRKEHFWIPDEEVIRIGKTLTGRTIPRNVSFEEHGKKLSHSLQTIKDIMDDLSDDNSLIDSDLMIFKIELPQGEKIKDKKELFLSTGMQIKTVKRENKAIVSTTQTQFRTLKKRIDDYMHSGTGRSYFDYIEDFKPYVGSEKNSRSLQRTTCADKIPLQLDIQLMLIPNLDTNTYDDAIEKITRKITKLDGEMQDIPYLLSDNTPIIRAIIPSAMLSHYENDPAIYRIEETDFFSADAAPAGSINLNHLEIDESVIIENLPIVTVLDSGVNFPKGLQPLIINHWKNESSHRAWHKGCK